MQCIIIYIDKMLDIYPLNPVHDNEIKNDIIYNIILMTYIHLLHYIMFRDFSTNKIVEIKDNLLQSSKNLTNL